MSAKMLTFTHPSEAHTEEVLKCIRETIRKQGQNIHRSYQPTKTAARNDQAFLTCIEDPEKAWKAKFERRKENLSHGFFADKTKPYQTVGTVYLEAGDLVLESVTDDLKSKISKRHQSVRESKKLFIRKPPSQQRKLHSRAPVASYKVDPLEATAGYGAIKCRIEEVTEMKKGVLAKQTLGGYLIKKESEMDVEDVADGKKGDYGALKMQAPQGRNWTILRSIGKIIGSHKQNTEVIEHGFPSGLARLFHKTKKNSKLAGIVTKLQKPLLGSDIRDLEENEIILMKWRKELRLGYLKAKLQAINSLFCALFNMKTKLLKLTHPLSYKVVKDLLRSDITMDEYGKPSAWKPPQHPANFDEMGIQSDVTVQPESNAEAPKTGSSPTSAQTTRKRNSSTIIPTTNSSRVHRSKFGTQIAKYMKHSFDTYGPKIETWEELLNAGERHNRHSLGGQKFKIRRRDTLAQVTLPEGMQPAWMFVAQAEKILFEKRRINIQGITAKRTAEDVLEDMRNDFIKLQKKLSKDVTDECNRQRMEQYKLIKYKFQTINLGPIQGVCLEKMRVEAKLKTRDRKDSSAKPLKWYVDLRTEVNNETEGQNEEITKLLQKVARFQYEDERSIPLVKEKLCLLVMSIPAHIILTVGMTDGISLILDKVLLAPSELLQHWLAGRKLDKISTMLKYQHRPKTTPKI